LKLCQGRRINVKQGTKDGREIRGKILGITLVPVLVGMMTGDGGLRAKGVMYYGLRFQRG